MLKAVIYDFDGTLASTFSLHLKAYKFALKKCGIDRDDDEIISRCFNNLDEDVAKTFGISDVHLFSKYYRDMLDIGFKKIKLYPNVILTLKKLKQQRIKLGIATSRERKEMEQVLDVLKIRIYFDSIITHDEVMKKKPDPEIFLAVCRKLKVTSDEIVIVGDAQTDLIAAKKMKAKSILFYPKEHEKVYLLRDLIKYDPVFVIKNNKDILTLLNKL